MNSIRISRSYYSKELPYISSVKPYFFSSHSRKSSVQASIGIQCEKTHSKRYPSEDYNNIFRNSGLINSTLLKKITSRPGSPIAIQNKSLNYIPSSRNRKKINENLKKTEYSYKGLQNLITNKLGKQTRFKEKNIASLRTINRRSTLAKNSRKAIKLSNSPGLIDCASNASIDYFMPRYKS